LRERKTVTPDAAQAHQWDMIGVTYHAAPGLEPEALDNPHGYGLAEHSVIGGESFGGHDPVRQLADVQRTFAPGRGHTYMCDLATLQNPVEVYVGRKLGRVAGQSKQPETSRDMGQVGLRLFDLALVPGNGRLYAITLPARREMTIGSPMSGS
jgi:hypothetical protein